VLDTPIARWVLAAIAALALVGLLAYARGEPGDDGRAPDPESAAAPVVLDASGALTAGA
jgi:hypothetical protein